MSTRVMLSRTAGLGLMLLVSGGGCGGGPDTTDALPSDRSTVDGAAGSGAAATAPKPPKKDVQGHTVVLGFDGMDPDVMDRLRAAGKLPNIQRVIDAGTAARLASTVPPQSPVAWSTFATGTNPGQHGIFDFVRRDPALYLPDVGTGKTDDAQFDMAGNVTTPARATNYRQGDSFWKVASQAGVEVEILNVPYAWPPDELPYGNQLSGLGISDLRGTNSTCYFFTTDVKEGATTAGGVKGVPLTLVGNRATGTLEGPKNQEKKRARVDVEFTLTGDEVQIEAQGQKASLKAGSWSDWFRFDFMVSPKAHVVGVGRFYAVRARGNDLLVYLMPVGSDPENPYIALSTPREFSGELARRHGTFKTVGWVEDTSALNSELLPEKAFLEDVKNSTDFLHKATLDALKDTPPPLVVSVFTAPDRISHMFYRLTDPKHPRYDAKLAKEFGSAIDQSYQWMDAIVGDVLSALPQDGTLILMSDHGFHNYRRGLHVNAWLVQEGYLVLKDGKTSSTKQFFQEVDWSRTRAYSVGTGQIYVNLKGREGKGIVNYGPEYDALLEEIATKLPQLVDEKTRQKPVARVYKGKDAWKGGQMASAPDMQLAFAENWRTSWETALGGIPAEMFADNDKKWSGDHAASDAADTEGILVVNRKVAVDKPHIADLPVTILGLLGVSPPAGVDGKKLF